MGRLPRPYASHALKASPMPQPASTQPGQKYPAPLQYQMMTRKMLTMQ